MNIQKKGDSLIDLVNEARQQGLTCVLPKEQPGIDQIGFDLREK